MEWANFAVIGVAVVVVMMIGLSRELDKFQRGPRPRRRRRRRRQ